MKRLETPHVRGVTIAKLTLVPLPIVSCVMPPSEIIFSKKVIVLDVGIVIKYMYYVCQQQLILE